MQSSQENTLMQTQLLLKMWTRCKDSMSMNKTKQKMISVAQFQTRHLMSVILGEYAGCQIPMSYSIRRSCWIIGISGTPLCYSDSSHILVSFIFLITVKVFKTLIFKIVKLFQKREIE